MNMKYTNQKLNKNIFNIKTNHMRKLSFSLIAVMIIIMTSLSSCAAIGGIFKAGIWTGVIGVALVVFLVIYLISRSRR